MINFKDNVEVLLKLNHPNSYKQKKYEIFMTNNRSPLIRDSECVFYNLSTLDVGYAAKRNSSIIYKSGDSLEKNC